jgi:CheY-like chemotaxis protein
VPQPTARPVAGRARPPRSSRGLLTPGPSRKTNAQHPQHRETVRTASPVRTQRPDHNDRLERETKDREGSKKAGDSSVGLHDSQHRDLPLDRLHPGICLGDPVAKSRRYVPSWTFMLCRELCPDSGVAKRPPVTADVYWSVILENDGRVFRKLPGCRLPSSAALGGLGEGVQRSRSVRWGRFLKPPRVPAHPVIVGCDAETVTVRCLIVDASDRFLQAARAMLEREGIDVVGVASTSGQALQRVSELRPDAALIAIRLGEESGVDLAGQLAGTGSAKRPEVILTSALTGADFGDMIAAWPCLGYLRKSDLSGDAVRALARKACKAVE